MRITVDAQLEQEKRDYNFFRKRLCSNYVCPTHQKIMQYKETIF